MFLAESYLHTLDPYVIQLTDGGFGIRWYGLAYVAGFLIAWSLIKWLANTGRSIVPPSRVADLMIYAIVGVLVGGRLGYAAFYDPSLFTDAARNMDGQVVPPWWALLAINQGGMASHGGMIGVLAAMLIFMIRHKLVPAIHAADLIAFVAPPGLFLGRMANFINGELWGHPIADQDNPAWWSVKYPEEIYFGETNLEQLRGVIPGDQTFLPGVVESLRAGDPVVTEVVVPQLTAYYPSQLFQALADGPILFLVLIAVWWVPRKGGVLTGTFLIAYGLLRTVTEMFRQPDEGVSLLMGLSRGQFLSVFMIVAGMLLLLIASKSRSQKLGGLGSPPITNQPSTS